MTTQCHAKIRVREECSEKLPFGDGEFDLVFARAVLHHARDIDAVCREAAAGGVFADHFFVGRDVDAVYFVAGDKALHPLDLRAKLV